jgi:NADPH-dependent curcumin reductase CurA
VTEPGTHRRIVMTERPSGRLELRHFRVETSPVPGRDDDSVLLRNVLLSVAPHARAVMQVPTYRPQLVAGEVIPSSGIAEVIAGPANGPEPGTVVHVRSAGWQEYSVALAAAVRPLPKIGRLSHHLGLLGLNGLTSYFGIREVARVSDGATVVVSGAAGGVGHLAGQLARMAGARVIGVTSSDEKNRVLKNELGYSDAVNWRSVSFSDDLHAVCPDGIDVYFDNVGGTVLKSILPRMVHHGRIVCCGVTSQYDRKSPPPGPEDLAMQLISKSLRMEGFLVADFQARWDEALDELRTLHETGRLTVLEDVRDGLDAAPAALIGMMAGKNVGQLAVRLGPDPLSWAASHERSRRE